MIQGIDPFVLHRAKVIITTSGATIVDCGERTGNGHAYVHLFPRTSPDTLIREINRRKAADEAAKRAITIMAEAQRLNAIPSGIPRAAAHKNTSTGRWEKTSPKPTIPLAEGLRDWARRMENGEVVE